MQTIRIMQWMIFVKSEIWQNNWTILIILSFSLKHKILVFRDMVIVMYTEKKPYFSSDLDGKFHFKKAGEKLYIKKCWKPLSLFQCLGSI